MKTYIAECIITAPLGDMYNEGEKFLRPGFVQMAEFVKQHNSNLPEHLQIHHKALSDNLRRIYSKIGKCMDADIRFNGGYVTDNPFEIKIHASCNFNIEKLLHHILSVFNIRGEWFIFHEKIFDLIVDTIEEIDKNEQLIKKMIKHNDDFINNLIKNLLNEINETFSGIIIENVQSYSDNLRPYMKLSEKNKDKLSKRFKDAAQSN